MDQGDIYIVNLDPTVRTEIGKTRPGLVISANAMNHNSPRLIVAPITSTTRKVYPFEVFIPRGTTGLDKDSKIMVDQLRSLDKNRLVKKIGGVDKKTLSKACSIAQRLISAD
ncbi:MAG: type II toxin-antitoxin system PemK/MazF family toxin [Proteobacteria bacterium]|nr:type II toxin-antitoxin system PemK/MazF family toxin [Desulfobacterales bacterium]MBL6967322.1 type II toxin-antitoxin system PemK/MazF family toxin [Desulfobacteraceae bacterium]MBU0736264.1 type II toxin-antitoxin system PemK/MazF family toxin [Pseudomonadota bacterium]MBL7102058.1 type II toxin-antitoxin system PemK/MazF family toxin [Desulfobacteraceae bacterium]MBL7172085.1 type II toxin-antitoxin system PemK/MazF family toxin [Desulfobacteraceae bacterium]